PFGRREGAPRAGAHPLHPPQLPGARRADQPPRHGDQGHDRARARRLRRDDAVRVARSPVPGQAVEPRAGAGVRGADALRRRLPGVRRPQRTRGARVAVAAVARGPPVVYRGRMIPVPPPVLPMLSKRIDALPEGQGWIFEPKWDGFRALVFRDGDDLTIQSRDEKPLNRYFPELVATLEAGL